MPSRKTSRKSASCPTRATSSCRRTPARATDRGGHRAGPRVGRHADRPGRRSFGDLSRAARDRAGARPRHDPPCRRPLRSLRRLRGRPLLARLPVRAHHGGGPRVASRAGRDSRGHASPARAGRAIRCRGDRHAGLAAGRAAGAVGAPVSLTRPRWPRPGICPWRVASGAGRTERARRARAYPRGAGPHRGRRRRGVQSRAGSHGPHRDGGGEVGEGSGRAYAGRECRRTRGTQA